MKIHKNCRNVLSNEDFGFTQWRDLSDDLRRAWPQTTSMRNPWQHLTTAMMTSDDNLNNGQTTLQRPQTWPWRPDDNPNDRIRRPRWRLNPSPEMHPPPKYIHLEKCIYPSKIAKEILSLQDRARWHRVKKSRDTFYLWNPFNGNTMQNTSWISKNRPAAAWFHKLMHSFPCGRNCSHPW